MSELFIKTLMDNLIEATMIPKVQVERVVGPILTVFLEDVLTETLKSDTDLSGLIKMICPEFPLKKAENKQSTNIDWLMYNTQRKQLLFVELKTSDTSINSSQNEIYQSVTNDIQNKSGAFLISDLEKLRVGQAAAILQNEFWHWFCDKALEQAKKGEISALKIEQGLETFLKLLHPFMPFITEAIWQDVLNKKSLLIKESWPK